MNAGIVTLIREHAIEIAVVAPMAGGAIAIVLRGASVGWAVALFAAGVAAFAAMALPLADGVGAGGIVDGVGCFVVPLVASATALLICAAGASLREIEAAPYSLALALCLSAAWCSALLAGNLIDIFVASEAAWLAGVAMVALSSKLDRGALNGAMRMLGAGGVSSALYLIGAGLAGSAFGSVELSAVASMRVAPDHAMSALVGIGLLIVSLAVKGGLAPAHYWVGAVIGRGGAFAASMIAGIGVVGAVATLVRLAVYALPAPAVGGGVSTLLILLGVGSVTIGCAQALGADNFRRLVGYVGSAHAGLVLISVGLGSFAGISAAFVLLCGWTASAVIMLCGAAAAPGGPALTMLDGLSKRAPLSCAAISLGALSLMGAPLTLGFLGRWRLIEASVGADWWWAAGASILASLAGVIFGGRLIERLYFRRRNAPANEAHGWSHLLLGPAMLAASALIAIGVAPQELLRVVGVAVAALPGMVAP